jgi:hypothetical protein
MRAALLTALDAITAEILRLRDEHACANPVRRAELVTRYALLEEAASALRLIAPEREESTTFAPSVRPSRLTALPPPPRRRATLTVITTGSWWTKPSADFAAESARIRRES